MELRRLFFYTTVLTTTGGIISPSLARRLAAGLARAIAPAQTRQGAPALIRTMQNDKCRAREKRPADGDYDAATARRHCSGARGAIPMGSTGPTKRMVSCRWVSMRAKQLVCEMYDETSRRDFKASRMWRSAFFRRSGLTVRHKTNSKRRSVMERRQLLLAWHRQLRLERSRVVFIVV